MTACVAQSILGIDIAKAKLDTHFQRVGSVDTPIHRRYDNTPAGHEQLVSWLATQPVGQLHVCLEATGTYGRAVALRLHQAGYRVSIVTPLRIKRSGQSELLRVKTDQSDAALIARLCLTQQPDPWTPPVPAQQQLQDLVRALADLQRLHQQERCRQQSGPQDSAVASVTSSVLTCVQTQMASLRTQIEAHILAHESLRTASDLLLSICGIGKRTAVVLLGELGDLSRFPNVRDLLASIGLAPHLQCSGSSVHGPSPLSKHGHSVLRTAVSFPALSAVRHNPAIRTLSQRWRAAGKPKMVALVAAMRKLVHQLSGVLRSGQVFDPAHVSARPVSQAADHSGPQGAAPQLHLTALPCGLPAHSQQHLTVGSVCAVSSPASVCAPAPFSVDAGRPLTFNTVSTGITRFGCQSSSGVRGRTRPSYSPMRLAKIIRTKHRPLKVLVFLLQLLQQLHILLAAQVQLCEEVGPPRACSPDRLFATPLRDFGVVA